jgi:UDP-N-acetyl-D-mannosaminuronic acid dehydrogenase
VVLQTSKSVCVIGLGYVGLPLALVIASSGYKVYGFDIDKQLVQNINLGKVHTNEPGLDHLLNKTLTNKSFVSFSSIVQAEIYIIAVPTMINIDYSPDLSYLYAALQSITTVIKENDIVIIESTCPVGTTEKISNQLYQKCKNICIAYCPERVFPGNVLDELLNNHRVIGGVDLESSHQVAQFYQSFVSGEIKTTDTRTAEAVKLVENAFRDTNIAYANEISILADYWGIDPFELIEIANKHPRVNILKPGPGVGGNCLAIDPWFIHDSAPKSSSLIVTSRKVNLFKTEWVIQKIKMALKHHNKNAIACLGFTYKPNVSDIRNSPANDIVRSLEKDTKVFKVDPFVPGSYQLSDVIDKVDIIVILVAHDQFLNISYETFKDKIILDFVGILS